MPNLFARELRQRSTDSERKLWHLLRNRQLEGHKFRRQQPIGPYVADFVCLECKLIIEADGGQHQAQSNYDEERTLYMESQGFRVLRFWNNDILTNPESTLETIRLALMTTIKGETESTGTQ
ncbi:hypothetical protein DLREEDagrD3_27360 [Denitratisoma sp. agr-D3]